MRFGIGTGATQIEGGCNQSNIWVWANGGHVVDNTDPYVACEHRLHVQSDAALIAALGVKDYRMGLEWARIEPSAGTFDTDVLQSYCNEIDLLASLGISVMVTLFHKTTPLWFEKTGGFERADSPQIFARYAARVEQALMGRVRDYITFEEPNTYAITAYLDGTLPPAVKKRRRARVVMGNLCAAHILAYRALHIGANRRGSAVRVSAALLWTVMEPKYRSGLTDVMACTRAQKLMRHSVAQGMLKGVFRSPLIRPKGFKPQRDAYYDFVCVNYFTRTVVGAHGHGVKERVPVSDTGAEIYPQGLGRVLKAVRAYFPDSPIMITANGVADKADAFRSRFIYEHVREAEESKVDVEAYYYYALMDGFEFGAGITAKYGLYENDFVMQQRSLRPSGQFYRDLVQDGQTSEALYQKYVSGQQYPTN